MKDYLFGSEYEISPAGGESGQAFVAIHEDEKFFLKRNSSPFLAALSVENIVPKLVWTRRVASGDVITAQKWVNCHILTADEMIDVRVCNLFKQIHTSEPLREMLSKIEQRDFSAHKLLERFELSRLKTDLLLMRCYHYLREYVNVISETKHVVCHGDINHNNWIISDDDDMYLVDWDEAMLADPYTDIGIFLYQYLPSSAWREWLDHYGVVYNLKGHKKLKWYALCQALYQQQTRISEQDKLKQLLTKILEDDEV